MRGSQLFSLGGRWLVLGDLFLLRQGSLLDLLEVSPPLLLKNLGCVCQSLLEEVDGTARMFAGHMSAQLSPVCKWLIADETGVVLTLLLGQSLNNHLCDESESFLQFQIFLFVALSHRFPLLISNFLNPVINGHFWVFFSLWGLFLAFFGQAVASLEFRLLSYRLFAFFLFHSMLSFGAEVLSIVE